MSLRSPLSLPGGVRPRGGPVVLAALGDAVPECVLELGVGVVEFERVEHRSCRLLVVAQRHKRRRAPVVRLGPRTVEGDGGVRVRERGLGERRRVRGGGGGGGGVKAATSSGGPKVGGSLWASGGMGNPTHKFTA